MYSITNNITSCNSWTFLSGGISFLLEKKTDMAVNILQYEDERSNLQPYYFLLHIPNQTKLMTFTVKP